MCSGSRLRSSSASSSAPSSTPRASAAARTRSAVDACTVVGERIADRSSQDPVDRAVVESRWRGPGSRTCRWRTCSRRRRPSAIRWPVPGRAVEHDRRAAAPPGSPGRAPRARPGRRRSGCPAARSGSTTVDTTPTQRPTRFLVSPRRKLSAYGFFFCGMITLVRLWASSSSTKPNSSVAQIWRSSQSRSTLVIEVITTVIGSVARSGAHIASRVCSITPVEPEQVGDPSAVHRDLRAVDAAGSGGGAVDQTRAPAGHARRRGRTG